jgi:hypothetical protein
MLLKTLVPVRLPTVRSVGLATAATLAVCGVAGCGGVGNTSSARLRAVDAATDAGTADILVNSSASFGDQTYFAVSSSYFFIATGSSSFTSLTSVTSNNSNTITARTASYTLNSGQFYTAYLVGRGDVTVTTDPRDLEVLVTDDTKPTISAGQAAIRVIDAAPDAGGVDVLVNGAAPDASFNNLTFQTAADNVFVGKYVSVAAGSLSVKVNATGTSTAIVPATTITVTAGKAYTILVTEPTGGTALLGTVGGTQPTYALQTTSE